MKKLFLIFILFSVVSIAYCIDIFSAECAIEVGWLPQGTLNMYEYVDTDVWLEGEHYWKMIEVKPYDLSNTFYALLETKVFLFNYFFMGGSIDVSMHKQEHGNTFSPEGIDYMFTTGFRLGIIEFFYKHNCIHPAPTYLYRYLFEPKWETAHDRIGIRIEGKF